MNNIKIILTKSNAGLRIYPRPYIIDGKLRCEKIMRKGICKSDAKLYYLEHELMGRKKWIWLCIRHIKKYIESDWKILYKLNQKQYLKLLRDYENN